jgi:hypothetical protein
VKLRQKRVDVKNLKLSAEEGFVLSRLDGATSVKELVALTGLDAGRVESIVGKLSAEGVLEVDDSPDAGPPSSSRGFGFVSTSPQTAAANPSSSRMQAAAPAEAHVLLDESPDVDAELRAFLRGEDPPEPPKPEPAPLDSGAPAEEGAQEEGEGETALLAGRPAKKPDRSDESDSELAAPESQPQVPEPTESDQALEEADKNVTEEEQRNERNYREIYARDYAAMSKDARIKAALEVTGADLMALCLDADPQIIHAVLQNPHSGLDHARMIAFHHRTQVGLEAVAKRTDHLKDALIQRRLLRNPQLPTTILNRIMNPKMMMEIYKTAIDREIPERTRVLTREILRKKFMIASSDEKAALLFKTEGRCLILLVNVSLDAHATQILCSKQNYTVLFIQNLARWSATPPPLLAHLLKTQLVRRNVGLRKMLLKHPNMPSEAKKNFAP